VRIVTLLTDFGTADGFAGVMEGVIASRAPRARVIHLGHDVPPGDIRRAAFVLRGAAPWFPRGTVHVAVVDPGVGTARRAVAIRSGGSWFVGPDNGVLAWAATRPDLALALDRSSVRLRPVSRTFHGRDVFAPAAAALAVGQHSARVGTPVSPGGLVRPSWPAPRRAGRGWHAEIVTLDRFGNAVTSLPETAWRRSFGAARAVASVRGRRYPEAPAYGGAAPRARLSVWGSAGLLELSMRGGSAAARDRLRPGAPVRVIPQ
jgi:hypothetical protein